MRHHGINLVTDQGSACQAGLQQPDSQQLLLVVVPHGVPVSLPLAQCPPSLVKTSDKILVPGQVRKSRVAITS